MLIVWDRLIVTERASSSAQKLADTYHFLFFVLTSKLSIA